ncbi:MAG: hypothetical protein ONB16_05400 [candidate division KSB1 bacterium]|nr:hypothetical protein [candidate division KSB1 bacterium]MDZ7317639.1 hypothetical protein [candidate division KSB1 bacterium]MDZ7341664.1 hypothetical protein [candidate division KSB1 bacterium]
MTEDLIPIVFFIMVVAIVKIISDNKIRRLAIEKGLVDQNLRSMFEERFEARVPAALKWGFVLVGIGLAIVIGRMFPDYMTEQVTIGCIFLFAGLGLVAYYFVAKRLMKKAKEEESELKQ